MAWKEVETEEFAKELGVDLETIKIKHELIDTIRKARKQRKFTQERLANLIGKSQSYVAKIESGIGTRNFSFELPLGILKKLGYQYKITIKEVPDSEILAA